MGFVFGWICTGMIIICITQLNIYFILKDILKELKTYKKSDF